MTEAKEIPMSPEEQKAFLGVVKRTKALVSAADRFVFEVASPPRAGSPMAEAHGRHQRDAFDIAGMLLFAAQDFLRTFIIVGESRSIPSFVLCPLLRTAAEATVRASYLLAPQLSHSERVARALNERLDNLLEQGKMILDENHMRQRVASLEARASTLGIEVRRSRRGEVDAFGEPRRGMVAHFDSYLEGGAEVYRILSAYAHSMQWMLLRRSNAQPADETGVSLVSTAIDPKLLTSLTDAVLNTFDVAVGNWVVLAGQPYEVWALAKQGA